MNLALEKLGYAGAPARSRPRRGEEGQADRNRPRIASPRWSAPATARTTTSSGCEMFDSAELRVHPTGKAILKLGVKSQGQGHETTFAQIVAEELGIPAEDIAVRRATPTTRPTASAPTRAARRRSRAPRRRSSRASCATRRRSSPPTCSSARRGRPRMGARAASPSRARPSASKTIQEIAFAAYTNLPEGMEAGLEGVHYYDPPNMTFPFGTYAVVVEIDRGTGQWKPRQGRRGRRLRRAHQPDDRRGPDHGRPHRGLRHRRHGADHLRRGRQLHRLRTSWTT